MSKLNKFAGAKSKLSTKGHLYQDQESDSVSNDYEDGFFVKVPLDTLKPDPNQPRKNFDPEALQELSDSIKKNGVLQPVIIRKQNDEFWLVAGERRYRAAKMAGLSEIPAIFTSGKPAEIALIENLQREDLNPIEEAQAYERMIKEYKYTQEMLALAIGKARATITNILGLNKLPEEIKKECLTSNISKRTLIEIARQNSPEKMISLFNQVKTLNLTSDKVRAIKKEAKEKIELSAAEIITKKINGLTQALNTTDKASISNEERLYLLQAIEDMQKALEGFLE